MAEKKIKHIEGGYSLPAWMVECPYCEWWLAHLDEDYSEGQMDDFLSEHIREEHEHEDA